MDGLEITDIVFIAFIVGMLVLMVRTRRSNNRYLDRNENYAAQALESQNRAIATMEQTNSLLAEISQKLDKR